MTRSFHVICNPICIILMFSMLCGPAFAQESVTTRTDGNQETTAAAKAQDDKDKDRDSEEKISSTDSIDLFLRLRRDRKRKPVSMETSVTRYETKNADGDRVTVDLIGVVHIGERAYYQQLNEEFKKYDCVLYELVAPEGTVVPRGGRESGGGMNPVAALQQGMQAILELEFQLEHIDYTVKNFVHADMTPEEFLESMEENEESFLRMALRAIGQSMAMQQSGSFSDFDLMMAMATGDTLKLRTIMAEQMQNMESGMVIFQGKDGSTIINHRNKKVMRIMEEQIAKGKKKIAIFYGAGHMPDFDHRMIKDYGMRRGGQYWLTAWKLK